MRRNLGLLLIGLSLLVAALNFSMKSIEQAIYVSNNIQWSSNLHILIGTEDLLTTIVIIMGVLLAFKKDKQ